MYSFISDKRRRHSLLRALADPGTGPLGSCKYNAEVFVHVAMRSRLHNDVFPGRRLNAVIARVLIQGGKSPEPIFFLA